MEEEVPWRQRPRTPRSWERQEGPSPKASRGSAAQDTPISDLCPERKRTHVCTALGRGRLRAQAQGAPGNLPPQPLGLHLQTLLCWFLLTSPLSEGRIHDEQISRGGGPRALCGLTFQALLDRSCLLTAILTGACGGQR